VKNRPNTYHRPPNIEDEAKTAPTLKVERKLELIRPKVFGFPNNLLLGRGEAALGRITSRTIIKILYTLEHPPPHRLSNLR
jgi:hypothetical protein